jgi:BMFP domain-containing protein YqiC
MHHNGQRAHTVGTVSGPAENKLTVDYKFGIIRFDFEEKIMDHQDFYTKFSANLDQTFVSGQAIGDEIHQLLRVAMTKTLSGLDIVSRDEFDAQQAVLKRSREKIDVLEQQVSEMEALIKNIAL